ncbi:MAG: amidohydrolase [Desulfomonile tiedjei]|uniref:Amidohydrolase n=1 Tax=Desulfomonile tiedjei TaxID=2358 RepID=A0A9D6V327_9BACT|nr:amidohydrolase [Desulfomonile tiedjei]
MDNEHTPSRREFLNWTVTTAAVTLGGWAGIARTASGAPATADLIVLNGRIATLDKKQPLVSAFAVKGDRFIAMGADADIMLHRGTETTVIDAKGRTVIPGLNDSHIHVIRGGLNYNMELRWDGVPSLADALRMLRDQARRTPPPQWVRVIGGWTEFQFAERRMPTLQEINEVAPETPVFVLHLYDRAFVNGAGLRALGYSKDTPDPIGGEMQRDRHGNPTGLLIAKPNALILYASLAKGPKLPYQDQLNSTRQFMRELNRLGVTSAIDAGGGFQNYPDDYAVVEELARNRQLTVRIAYNLFTQRPKGELEDFAKWVKITHPGNGDDFYRVNGAGEMLVYSAADFEDFLEPRPDLVPVMEDELNAVIRLLVKSRWPFRLHATYDESISRFLNVFEDVNRAVPFDGLRWFFDHAEMITPRNMERVKELGGGIAIQDRMAFQGEYFINRYGPKAAEVAPPITQMLHMGIPVGAGTDATRVSSYNPWTSLYWLVTGKTVGGTALYQQANRLDRMEALRLFTQGSSWFSGEETKKGAIGVGQLADFAILSEDYFSVPEEDIKGLESVLTVVGGKPVYAAKEFEPLGPSLVPVSPDWSPVAVYGGHMKARRPSALLRAPAATTGGIAHTHKWAKGDYGLWRLGCDCFAF